ncbi:MAG TPA: hypothetical protein VN616_15270 [Puia sp.]|nr:hypothetical protein [Puia sp.]
MPPDRSLHAVLTADIVNSTGLGSRMESLLQQELQLALSPYAVEFYRGDSFQAYLDRPEGALRIALLCRALAISLPERSGTEKDMPDESMAVSDIRISIGLGTVQLPVKAPGTAKGEAFLLSGRGLDDIQRTERRLAILCGHAVANIGLEAMAYHLDAIFRTMTAKQAAAICWLLRGATQQEVTGQLNKSKSTVSQLVSAGNWAEIEKILQQFDMLIKELS